MLSTLAVLALVSGTVLGWKPNSYSQSFANRTLMYAYGAYCEEAELLAWTCKWCQYVPKFEIDMVENKDSLQVFTGYDPTEKQVVISFRGTHNVKDWLDDLDFISIDYPGVDGGKVHQGFYDAWVDLKSKVMGSAQQLMDKYKGQQILITGHSLGAALAQLCSLDVSSYANSTNNNGYIFVEDFGSPRWGNEVMVDYFKSSVGTHWRLVNVYDIVPTVPPEDKNYHHTPNEIWYTSDSPLKYTQCDGSGEDSNCDYHHLVSIEDHLHYMNLYEDCES